MDAAMVGVRSQVDVIHFVSNPHLHSVKSCPEKSRPTKNGGPMHGVMIVIEYSYKLDRKNILIYGAN